jgi:hypothetical protein
MPTGPVVLHAVEVEVAVRADVEGQPAVGLQDEAELVVVEQGPAPRRSRDLGGEQAAEDEGVGLVERRHALVAVDARRDRTGRSSPLPTT